MSKKAPHPADVHIDLSRPEFHRLLHMLYIASWVLDAHKTEDDPRTEPYRRLEQKLFAIAVQNGFDDLVYYDDEFDTHFPTRELEEGGAHAFINEYDNDTFWDELINRLAERDVIREAGGVEPYLQLSFEEKIGRLGRQEAFYASEFHESGLDNIQIKESDE